jgi:hypothetical protein
MSLVLRGAELIKKEKGALTVGIRECPIYSSQTMDASLSQ